MHNLKRFPSDSSEVIITYDCSVADDPFGKELHKMITQKLKGEMITKSTYRLGARYPSNEVYKIEQLIKILFEKAAIILEGEKQKRTVIKIITPNVNEFTIVTVIDEIK
jgi:hypothetical protein